MPLTDKLIIVTN